jgi:hypothetical protein
MPDWRGEGVEVDVFGMVGDDREWERGAIRCSGGDAM